MRPKFNWIELQTIDQFDDLLEKSRLKPSLIFRHRSTSPESISVKMRLEDEWSISKDLLDIYIVDDLKSKDVSRFITDNSGVDHIFPQVLLFADGVAMYDESKEMINVKKIKIALKIINRTFKWMESRA